MIKNGTRLQSQVDDTQVIVIRSAPSLADLRCGGTKMVPLGTAGQLVAIATGLAGGTQIGKRYVDDDGAEILVTKSGQGTLSVGDRLLALKESKPLPASD